MLKRKQNKKKKGFTLIELVIVLAVLAIIALIAIPNFTRVRNNALQQADDTSCEQITNITQTAIAEGVIKPVLGSSYTIGITFPNGVLTINCSAPFGKDAAGTQFSNQELQNEHYRDIKAPQVAGKVSYLVSIGTNGAVSTETKTAPAP